MPESFRTNLPETSVDRQFRDLEGAVRASNAGKSVQVEKRVDAADPVAVPVARSGSPAAIHESSDFRSPRQISKPSSTDASDAPLRFDPYSDKPVRIAIKSKGKILLINPADILAVEAEGNYVSLLHASGSHLLRESISSITEKLRRYGFVRIHRSVIVNASCVEEISPGSAGDYILHIAGGKQYVVSRTYRHNLKLLAHSWIGLDSFVAD
jgi:DNA-binding LytR/AlgR family response regulator